MSSNVDQLMAMGFSRDAVNTALAMNNNNLDNALSLLLNQSTMVENTTITTQQVPPTYQQATAIPVSATLSSSNISSHNIFESMAQALSGNRPALDAVNGIVEKLLKNPKDQTVAVLQLAGSLAPIKSSDNAVNFLKELGYNWRSGFLMLKSAPQSLYEAKSAINKAMANEQYNVSTLLESSRLAAIEESRYKRNLLREKKVRPEPSQGSGQVCTRLVFHFNEDGAPSRTLERRFEPDECLSDAIHFLGTLDEKVLDGHSWELVENSGAPYWWCNGWELSDITLRPATTLKKTDATKTLQGLGLWPSAQISVKVTKLDGSTSSANSSKVTKSTQLSSSNKNESSGGLIGENYLRGRPTPSMVMKSATSRFESIPLNGKEHNNVNRNAAQARAAAAEARMNSQKNQSMEKSTSNKNGSGAVEELMAMGFSEIQVRNALASSKGDQARAVEILLR